MFDDVVVHVDEDPVLFFFKEKKQRMESLSPSQVEPKKKNPKQFHCVLSFSLEGIKFSSLPGTLSVSVSLSRGSK